MKHKRKQKRAEHRSYSTNYQLRHRARGLCGKCPNLAGLNPHTGKAYHFCPACRAKAAARNKLIMRARRAAGIAPGR